MAKAKKIGGRVVAMWKRELFATGKDDQDIAAAINARADKEGYSYRVDAEKVQGWRQKSKRRTRRKHARPVMDGAVAPKPTTHPVSTKGLTTDKVLALHGLVKELGASEVKKLVEGFNR